MRRQADEIDGSEHPRPNQTDRRARFELSMVNRPRPRDGNNLKGRKARVVPPQVVSRDRNPEDSIDCWSRDLVRSCTTCTCLFSCSRFPKGICPGSCRESKNPQPKGKKKYQHVLPSSSLHANSRVPGGACRSIVLLVRTTTRRTAQGGGECCGLLLVLSATARPSLTCSHAR